MAGCDTVLVVCFLVMKGLGQDSLFEVLGASLREESHEISDLGMKLNICGAKRAIETFTEQVLA